MRAPSREVPSIIFLRHLAVNDPFTLLQPTHGIDLPPFIVPLPILELDSPPPHFTPPTRIMAPSKASATASSKLDTILLIAIDVYLLAEMLTWFCKHSVPAPSKTGKNTHPISSTSRFHPEVPGTCFRRTGAISMGLWFDKLTKNGYPLLRFAMILSMGTGPFVSAEYRTVTLLIRGAPIGYFRAFRHPLRIWHGIRIRNGCTLTILWAASLAGVRESIFVILPEGQQRRSRT